MPLKTTSGNYGEIAKGRGAQGNPEGRFERFQREPVPVGIKPIEGEDGQRLPTVVTIEAARSAISRHDSPDIVHRQAVNPYRGCEHGCIYCYARPSHGYLGLSPGLDFETRIFAKPDAPKLLREELLRPSYRCQPIVIGSNTDGYQPLERRMGITRSILAVLNEFSHPVAIVTKSAAVERDLDMLAAMSLSRLVSVTVSVTTMDARLSRLMEPRASAPGRRLEVISRLSSAGIPVGVNVAPVIPFLTDHEIEDILDAAVSAGASWAGWTLLRLPYELRDLFPQWLEAHFPLRAAHIMSRLRDMRGGLDNDPRFGTRMTGEGPIAQIVRQRFESARRRHGLEGSPPELACDRFRPPGPAGQTSLF